MAYGAIAGAAAIVPEILFRSTTLPWWRLAPATIPCSVIISYCVCELVRGTESLPDAFIVFALATTALRLVASLILGDHIALGTWAGLALVALARVAQTWLK